MESCRADDLCGVATALSTVPTLTFWTGKTRIVFANECFWLRIWDGATPRQRQRATIEGLQHLKEATSCGVELPTHERETLAGVYAMKMQRRYLKILLPFKWRRTEHAGWTTQPGDAAEPQPATSLVEEGPADVPVHCSLHAKVNLWQML